MPEPTSVLAAYKLGLEYLPYDAPPVPVFVRQTVAGTKDGPCELLFRQLEMLPIDDLDKKSAYTIGIAVRCAGFLLDMSGEDPDFAMRVHGELAEATQDHMEGYRAGIHGPYSHEIFVSHFLNVFGFDDPDAVRAAFAAYIENALVQPFQWTDEWFGQLMPLYAHPDVEAACTDLLDGAPAYHVDSSVYDACEISSWYGMGPQAGAGVFKIVVDGETWPNLVSNPMVQAQSEFLLVDAREDVWRLYERIALRGMGVPQGTAQISGVLYNSFSGDYQPIESNSVYVPNGETHAQFEMDILQQARIVRVMLSVLMLIESNKVRVTRIAGNGSRSYKVKLPARLTVDEIVEDVQRGRDSQRSASSG